MDKFIKRTTERKTTKRNYVSAESSNDKKRDSSPAIKDKSKHEATKLTIPPNPPSGSNWHRCDSLTEAEHRIKKSDASPKKRKKLEHKWSPIKPLATLATIAEYPPLMNNTEENSRLSTKENATPTTTTTTTLIKSVSNLDNETTMDSTTKPSAAAAAATILNNSSPSTNCFDKNDSNTKDKNDSDSSWVQDESGVSLYDLALDFGNKSWADLVLEEEKEEAERQRQEQKTEKQQQETNPNSSKSRRKSSTTTTTTKPKNTNEKTDALLLSPPSPSKSKSSSRKNRIRFEEDSSLTQMVGDCFKFDRRKTATPRRYDKDEDEDRRRRRSRRGSSPSTSKSKHSMESSKNKTTEAPYSPWTSRLRNSPFKKTDESRNRSRDDKESKKISSSSTATSFDKNDRESTSNKQRQTPKRLLNASGGRAASTPKSPKFSKTTVISNAWRKKPLLDEDSQNTLTEVAEITRSIQSKPKSEDESTRLSCFGAERPRRSGVGPPVRFPRPEHYAEPKLGWEDNGTILERRDKDLNKGYNSDVYKKYLEVVNKKDRVKGVHPRTPNKYLKMPRRSWDTQVRVWRRLLYAAVNIDLPSDCSFISSSNCSETTSEHDCNEMKMDFEEDMKTIQDPSQGDDCTMKAETCSVTVDGPIDFATLSTND